MNPVFRTLVIVALVLGVLAMLVRNPREHRPTTEVKELARMIEKEEDHVTSEELAEMLMKKNLNLHVVDVRDSSAYSVSHIPTAVRRDVSALMDTSFAESDTVVLYSDGGIHAAQAWMLLVLQGKKNIFTLRGGMNDWEDRILHPRVHPEMSTTERQKLLERTWFFGGEVKGEAREKKQPEKARPVTPPAKNSLREQKKPREVC